VTPTAPVELSVVFALKAARTPDPLEGVRAWTQGQTCSRERFEVIVAANGDHPELERRVPEVLGPMDRLISPRPRLGTFGLMDAGARAARGRWIYVCELHTIPEPDCAAELLDHLTLHDAAGAWAWSGSRGEGPLARMEARYFRDVVPIARARGPEGPAPPVPLRGVALRRDVLEKAGGIPADYSLFAERVLAARVREMGFEIGCAERARFDHFEQTSLRGHRVDVSLFTWGEMAFRARHDAAFCDHHFGRPIEWAERDGYRHELAWLRRRAAARALGGALRSPRPERLARLPGLGREWLRHGLRSGLGAWAESAGAWLATGAAELRFRTAGGDDERRYRALVDVKARYTRCVRLWCLGRHVRDVPLAPPQRQGDDRLPPEPQLVGFHDVETWQGETFRWTQPCATVRLALEPGDYQVRVRTGGLRPDLVRAPIAVLWNEHAIPDARIQRGQDAIGFPVEHGLCREGTEQRLSLACPPVRVPPGSTETRRLGWPVFALDVRPVS